MTKMYRIKIDEEVFAQLQKEATPFVDEPNDVLRRMLALSHNGEGKVKETSKTRERIPSQYLLPLEEYRTPILESLNNHGGTATRKAVLSDVFGELEHHLKPNDLVTLNGRPARWHSRTEFVKSQMQKEGLVESARQGMWRITDEGRKKVGEVL